MNCVRKREKLGICLIASVVVFSFAALLHAQDRTWDVNSDGDWSLAGNWDPADVPNTDAENAIITSPDGTTDVTVTLSSNLDVGDVTILGNGVNPDHELILDNNVFFDIFGNLANDGIVRLNSAGSTTRLRAENSDLNITGSGSILLGANNANSLGAVSDLRITNGANHTIAGQGNVGIDTARFTNLGTIEANINGGTLTLDPRSGGADVVTFDNQGNANATGGGLLKLTGNGGGEFSGGNYSAAAGSEVVLGENAIVSNATFNTSGDGLIRVAGITPQGASFRDITVNGNLQIDTELEVSGTFSTSGSAVLSDILFLKGDANFTGSGALTMQQAIAATIPAIRGRDAVRHLTIGENFTIQGEGRLGGALLTVTNEGLIDANFNGDELALDPQTSVAGEVNFDNQGIVQASGGGQIILTSLAGDKIFGGSGVYQALAGSTLSVNRNVTVQDSTFTTVADGEILIGGPSGGGGAPGGGDGRFVRVTNNGIVNVLTDLLLQDSLVNTGSITLANNGSASQIQVESNTLLSGGGTITMLASNASVVDSAGSNVTLTNVDNTIQGQGSIGSQDLQVINQSLIHANINGGTLRLQGGSPGSGALGFDNQGTVRASGGGIVVLNGDRDDFGGSGTYEVLADSMLFINRSAVVRDTTFDIQSNGFVQVGGGGATGGGTLTNITTNGDLRFLNGTDINGTIDNSGEITLLPGNQTNLVSDTILTGGGTVTLQGSTSTLGSILFNQTLTNVNNTIQGPGVLGSGRLQIVNQGLIDSNVNGGTLVLQVDSPAAGIIGFDNQSIVQASGGGRIVITRGSGDGEFGGSGTYQALAGSEISLERGVILRNTTLDTAGDGVVRSTFFNNTFVDVTNDGLVETSSTWRVGGTLTNNGTIDMQGGSVTAFDAQAEIEVTSTGSLTGSGAVDVPVVNNGSVVGSTFLEFNNVLSGEGPLENVRIDNIHAPGNSTAAVPLSGDYTIANSGELHLEIGGLTAGTEFDQLDSTGNVIIDGDLVVTFTDLGNGYVPEPGDQFTIITSDNPISGTFDTASFPLAGGGRLLTWDQVDYSDPMSVVIEIASASPTPDIDNDGDVDGADFLWIQRNDPSLLPLWQSQYPTPLSASQAVPEPATVLLMALSLVVAASTVRHHT